MAGKFTLESNREYWEDARTVSIIDSNLRDLEVQFISSYLAPHQVIADIGCGDGLGTIRYAEKVRQCCGIERSALMRSKARAAAAQAGRSNVEIIDGDILDLAAYKNQFDVVITERVLINLPDWELQARAIDNIRACLVPGGLYLLIENTNDANDLMNEYRRLVGLPDIPKHWHNEFLDLEVFLGYLEGRFEVIKRHGFSLYYLLTRVYVQMFASFTGHGADAVADPIFEKSDRAARILQQKIGERLVFEDNPVFGPIQGFALRRVEG